MKREIVNKNDTIRAHDFKPCLGRGDMYVEGVVVDVVKPHNDYHYYLIKCTRDVVDGDDEQTYSRVGTEIKVPIMTSNDYPNRVINLTRI